MTVFTCAQTNVLSVKPDATVRFVADLMKEKNIGWIVTLHSVVKRSVGILTRPLSEAS